MRRFDVVILGGAFAGASAAILLRREQSDLSVLIVERAAAFDMKVGEATTEMSAMFLTRRLAIWNHLEVEQLPKEGLRYWFTSERVKSHADASETGGFLLLAGTTSCTHSGSVRWLRWLRRPAILKPTRSCS